MSHMTGNGAVPTETRIAPAMVELAKTRSMAKAVKAGTRKPEDDEYEWQDSKGNVVEGDAYVPGGKFRKKRAPMATSTILSGGETLG